MESFSFIWTSVPHTLSLTINIIQASYLTDNKNNYNIEIRAYMEYKIVEMNSQKIKTTLKTYSISLNFVIIFPLGLF